MRTCQLYIGRLVSHPCGRKTAMLCPSCRRAVCDRHLARPGDPRCGQCAGVYTPPQAPIQVSQEEMFAFAPEEIAAFDAPPGARGPALVGQADDS